MLKDFDPGQVVQVFLEQIVYFMLENIKNTEKKKECNQL